MFRLVPYPCVTLWCTLLHYVHERAIRSYNDWQLEKQLMRDNYIEYTPASIHSDKEFIDRITVNYIRHELTDYDRHLYELTGRVGKGLAYVECNRRIYREIARVYPSYTDECKKQFKHKFHLNLDGNF